MTQTREHWSSRFGFIMAAIGSAIGLGILWKFPYTVGQNGGGLFILCYFLFVLVIGIPLFIGELILGRATQKAAISAYTESSGGKPLWKIAGVFGVMSSFLIMSFYSVIAGWGLSYIVMSLSGFYQGLSKEQFANVFTELSKSGGISLFWHFVFTAITMGIVFSGVRKGIEFWSKIMTRSLLILLTLLFCYSLTMDGFGEAFRFVFYPSVSKFSFSSALEALGLAFFTLSLGQGIMISYGSYMKKEENIPKMAGIVGSSVVIVAILAALTIFPVVFTFNLPPQAGTGLIFQTLPYLFAKLPGSMVLSTLFFILFVFTALTSAIPLIEVVATNLMELFSIKRKKAVLMVGCATFVFGIPSAFAASGGIFPDWEFIYGKNFLETIDYLVTMWLIPVGALLGSIFMGWIFDKKRSSDEFCTDGKGLVLWKIWHFFIRWIIPITILLVIVQKSGLINL